MKLLLLATVLWVTTVLSAGAIALDNPDQDTSSQGIQLIVPFASGGGSDTWARILSSTARDHLSTSLQPHNIPGSGGTLGWAELLRRPADGQHLILGTPTPVLTALMTPQTIAPQDIQIVAYVSAYRSLLLSQRIFTQRHRAPRHWHDLVTRSQATETPYTVGGTLALVLGVANVLAQADVQVDYRIYNDSDEAIKDFLYGRLDLLAVTEDTAGLLVPENARVILNSSNIPFNSHQAELFGSSIPTAQDLGFEGISFPRFIGAHPETTEAALQDLSTAFAGMMTDARVLEMVRHSGSEAIFLGYPAAQVDYTANVERLRLTLSQLEPLLNR